MAQLTPAQQLMYANMLLPGVPDDPQLPFPRRRTNEPEALVAPEDCDLDAEACNSQDMRNPMAGDRFASMSGSGPCGFRLEHFAAMLKCNRRRPYRSREHRSQRNSTGRWVGLGHGFTVDLHVEEIWNGS